MPPKKKQNPLFNDLAAISNDQLEDGVERTEGVNGSTVEPIYSTRKMHCYSVTESELRQIGLANIGITAFSSLGTACLAFALDIFKDTLLAGSVPVGAQVAVSYAQPILLFFGLAFWAFAGVTIWWRKGLIDLIKEESRNP